MYIKEVEIHNYRNFESITIPLNKFTILIGENDIGKSNVIEAIKLVLNNNTFQFASKTLGITDINSNKVKKFKEIVETQETKIVEAIKDKNLTYFNDIIPIVKIKLKIVEAADDYQKALLSDWLSEDEFGDCYEVEYIFKPKDEIKFMNEILDISRLGKDYNLPLNMYEYKIISSNNGKGVRFDKFQNFNISYIGAERDNFSENDKQMSYKLISALLEKNLSREDRYKADQAYANFFDELKKLNSYKDVFEKFENSDFDNWREIVNRLELGPNTPNFKSIFSNINMIYGEEFLYQKGLGTRNLLLIILLLTNYLNDEERKFNLISIEEPEAHMCVNNLNIAIDFITKSIEKIEKNNFTQLIITTHNYNIINKLKFQNVVLLKDNNPISFAKYKDISDYLAKRPNYDILKILLAKRVILVEGPTEEMYINTYLQQNTTTLNMAEVIVTGKGYKKFLDIWKSINECTDEKKSVDKKIGVVRDYDNQPEAKKNHDTYDDEKNIFVRTSQNYTFENDLITQGNNKQVLNELFKEEMNDEKLEDYMTNNRNKTKNMLKICNNILDNKITLEIPKYIEEIINGVCKK